MPNVRASSGMIGTTRGPKPSARARLRSSRVKAMVVDTACLPDPAANSANGVVGRQGQRAAHVRRCATGSGPPSARRRSHQVAVLGGVLGGR